MNSDGIEVKKSCLDIYAEHITYWHELLSYNLVNFFPKYDVADRKLTTKLHTSIIQTIPNSSSNFSKIFDKFCKYQLPVTYQL